jgi:spore germination cell wall hydrolase CwlJ-like protein
MLARAEAPTEGPEGYERRLVAWVILAEARGEGRVGMQAVYEVLWMRAQNRGISLREVVLQPKQFAPLIGVKPAKLGQRMSKVPQYKWVHDVLLRFVPLTVHTVPAGMEKIAPNRADHFHSGKVPSWCKGKPSVEIGGHKFYKLN